MTSGFLAHSTWLIGQSAAYTRFLSSAGTSGDVSGLAIPAGLVIIVTLGVSSPSCGVEGAFVFFAAHSSACCTCCSRLLATSFSPIVVAAARILWAMMRASHNRLLVYKTYAR